MEANSCKLIYNNKRWRLIDRIINCIISDLKIRRSLSQSLHEFGNWIVDPKDISWPSAQFVSIVFSRIFTSGHTSWLPKNLLHGDVNSRSNHWNEPDKGLGDPIFSSPHITRSDKTSLLIWNRDISLTLVKVPSSLYIRQFLINKSN